jgi:hypothetical protein
MNTWHMITMHVHSADDHDGLQGMHFLKSTSVFDPAINKNFPAWLNKPY